MIFISKLCTLTAICNNEFHRISFYFQIKTLFRDHTDLLEEFWEFFKQLYPQVQDEDRADSVSNVEMNQGLEESQSYQSINIVIPDNKVETAIKHRRKKDRHAQVTQLLLWVTFPIYSMSIEISSHLKLCSP